MQTEQSPRNKSPLTKYNLDLKYDKLEDKFSVTTLHQIFVESLLCAGLWYSMEQHKQVSALTIYANGDKC